MRTWTGLSVALLAALATWLWRWAGRTPERRRRETLAARSFLGIPFLHLAVFSFGPLAFTVYLAFHEWSPVEPARPFVGRANLAELARAPLFWTTLRNTALYTTYVPITMAAALGLAILLNRRRGGERLLRTVVFLPFVTSTVAIAIVWQWMFNPDFGLANYLLSFLGIGPVNWLGSPRTALLAIVMVVADGVLSRTARGRRALGAEDLPQGSLTALGDRFLVALPGPRPCCGVGPAQRRRERLRAGRLRFGQHHAVARAGRPASRRPAGAQAWSSSRLCPVSERMPVTSCTVSRQPR